MVRQMGVGASQVAISPGIFQVPGGLLVGTAVGRPLNCSGRGLDTFDARLSCH